MNSTLVTNWGDLEATHGEGDSLSIFVFDRKERRLCFVRAEIAEVSYQGGEGFAEALNSHTLALTRLSPQYGARTLEFDRRDCGGSFTADLRGYTVEVSYRPGFGWGFVIWQGHAALCGRSVPDWQLTEAMAQGEQELFLRLLQSGEIKPASDEGLIKAPVKPWIREKYERGER